MLTSSLACRVDSLGTICPRLVSSDSATPVERRAVYPLPTGGRESWLVDLSEVQDCNGSAKAKTNPTFGS